MEHPLDRQYRLNERRRFMYARNPRSALLRSSRTSARARGHEHTLKLSDIKIPLKCPVLGVDMKTGGRDFESATVDRIDSSRGYTPDNVQVISWRANKLKSDGTLEEFEKIVQYMKNHLTG